MNNLNDLFEGQQYCDFNASAVNALAGKDIWIAFFSNDGASLLAIAGQQNLTLSRTKDTSEVNTKDSGGWKSKTPGLKEWGLDVDGAFIRDDKSHKQLTEAFDEDINLCIKILDMKRKKPMYGGIALLSEYSFEAPYDDTATYSLKLDGVGKLVDLSDSTTTPALPGDIVTTTEAPLLSLSFSNIDLSPAFDPKTKAYSMKTSNSSAYIYFTQPINTTVVGTFGNKTFSTSETELLLSTGENKIKLETSAPAIQGGDTRSSVYTITITKES